MKKNYFRLVFYFFIWLVLLTLVSYPQLSKGQTFATGFNSYVTNDLYLNGWDFSTAEWSIVNLRHSLLIILLVLIFQPIFLFIHYSLAILSFLQAHQ